MTRQPQTDTQIMCLECSRWYAALQAHLWLVHGIRPDEYRERHGLRIHKPLSARSVVLRLSEASAATVRARPDIAARLKHAMRLRVAERRSGRATARAQATRTDWLRPELRAEMAARRAAINRDHGAATLAAMETYARRAGYGSLRAYFAADIPDRVIAAAVGLSTSRVGAIRVGLTGARRKTGPRPQVKAPPPDHGCP